MMMSFVVLAETKNRIIVLRFLQKQEIKVQGGLLFRREGTGQHIFAPVCVCVYYVCVFVTAIPIPKMFAPVGPVRLF